MAKQNSLVLEKIAKSNITVFPKRRMKTQYPKIEDITENWLSKCKNRAFKRSLRMHHAKALLTKLYSKRKVAPTVVQEYLDTINGPYWKIFLGKEVPFHKNLPIMLGQTKNKNIHIDRNCSKSDLIKELKKLYSGEKTDKIKRTLYSIQDKMAEEAISQMKQQKNNFGQKEWEWVDNLYKMYWLLYKKYL